MTNHKVSVIICTLNRPTLINCLESVYDQNYKNFEVIVVSPKENTRKAILNCSNPNFNGIKFLLSDKANVSRQRNIGIRQASGEIVVFIDDDATAERDWIFNLKKNYEDDQVMCVGGRIVPKFLGEIPEELKNLPKEIYKGFLGETLLEFQSTTIINQPLLWGSNISFRKKIFEIIGEFDEELGKTDDKLLCEEEIEIQTRILKKGYKIVYEPSSVVIHLAGSEKLTKEFFIKRSFWQGVSETIKVRKSSNFQNTMNILNRSQLKYTNDIKLLELLFELSANDTLENSVKISYEIGRIAGLSSLIKR